MKRPLTFDCLEHRLTLDGAPAQMGGAVPPDPALTVTLSPLAQAGVTTTDVINALADAEEQDLAEQNLFGGSDTVSSEELNTLMELIQEAQFNQDFGFPSGPDAFAPPNQ